VLIVAVKLSNTTIANIFVRFPLIQFVGLAIAGAGQL
jgi:hypothetical protein